MASILGALSINSGSSSLKSIDGQSVFLDDICFVVTTTGFYVYKLDDSNTSDEDIPLIVEPSSNAGNKRWLLVSSRRFTENVEMEKDTYIKLREVREKDSDGVIFTLNDGTEVMRVDSDGLILGRDLTITNDNLNIGSINDIDIDEWIKSDGSVSFTGRVKGVTPVSDDDLVIKEYVDGLLVPDLSNYIEFDNTTSFTPVDDYNPASKKYVDDSVSGITGTYMSEGVYDTDNDGVVEEADVITGQGSLATLSVVTSAYIDSETAPFDYILVSDGSGGVNWEENISYTDSDVESYLSGGTGINFSSGIISVDSTIIQTTTTTAEISAADWVTTDATLIDGDEIPTADAVKTFVEENVGGGSGLPQLMPENMSLDDTDIAVSRGDAFNMIETLDFDGSDDGSVWITFHFPSSLDDTSDINLDLYYHLSGSDDSTIVRFVTDYWCTSVGTMPLSGSPDDTNIDDISTGTGEDGEIRKETLTPISNLDITAGDTVTLKFKREGSSASDTYSGTLQMLYVFLYQD